eukprot:TRINITY_DN24753_c0_g1_i10.p1 TRINITY_DN24753_c0_g1~~TRINITY_DN24753_c0_g1_i10.p1  ORF type:complete len:1101 (+),score=168.83 TRINITY_DN24753_c0_g1_i10:61-3303(+)
MAVNKNLSRTYVNKFPFFNFPKSLSIQPRKSKLLFHKSPQLPKVRLSRTCFALLQSVEAKSQKSPEVNLSLSVQQLCNLNDRDVDTELLSPEELAVGLNTSLQQGISTDARSLEKRRQEYGTNKLPEPDPVSFFELVKCAFQDITIILLLICGIGDLGVELSLQANDGSWLEGAAILFTVFLVVTVTATVEYQKERQFQALSALNRDQQVRVIRDGEQTTISLFDVLVGDLVVVEAGNIMPADCYLIQSDDIKVDESHMTGESDDIDKNVLNDPILLSGSKVLAGAGKALVTAVGPNSQQGVIQNLLLSKQRKDVQDLPDDELEQAGLQTLQQDTVLIRQLRQLAESIGIFGFGAATLTFLLVAGIFTYQTFILEGASWDWEYLRKYVEAVTTGITVFVVAVPEGLPLAVTLALAFSVKRMLSTNNLVRHLSACETMGCATTICTDKTGTLTENNLDVVYMWTAGRTFRNPSVPKFLRQQRAQDIDNKVWEYLQQSLAINSTATAKFEGGTWQLQGNRTECAMLKLAVNMGANIEEIRCQQEVVRTFTFSSQRKRMSAVCQKIYQSCNGDDQLILYSKGAAEIMLQLCSRWLDVDGQPQPLTDELRDELSRGFGEKDLRVLCTCYREVQGNLNNGGIGEEEQIENDLVLISMMGMRDTIRPEVPGAIKGCQRAGIDVKMLTGDNKITASAIAKQVGILSTIPIHFPDNHTQQDIDEEHKTNEIQISNYDSSQLKLMNVSWDDQQFSEIEGELVLEGKQFRRLVMNQDGSVDKQMFRKVWRSLKVLARCSPMDKYVMVTGCKLLKEDEEEVVAMTGDGTNDAPALRMADVGFAMNSGTSIAKEASDILIMDDNFNSIVQAVKWGRNVYAGIIKFLQFQLTINGVAVTTACVGAAVYQQSPLTAVQMLWVNLIMDSLASLALATEHPTDAMLDLPPFRANEPLITNVVWKNMIGQGVYQLAVMYFLVFQGDEILGVDKDVQLTLVFNAFVMMQLFNQVNCRKIFGEESVLEKIFDNRWFVGILAGEAFLQFLIVQFGGDAFQTVPLGPQLWAVCLGFGALSLVVRQILLKIPPFNDSSLKIQ